MGKYSWKFRIWESIPGDSKYGKVYLEIKNMGKYTWRLRIWESIPGN